jgi:putative transposase
MPRRAAEIVLSDEEVTELTMWSRSSALDHRYVLRARVILLWREGRTLKETSEMTGLARSACNQWRRRFEHARIAGLREAPRPGRPKTVSPATRASVIETARSTPPKGCTRWNQRSIAKVCGVSQSTVHMVLAQADLKPHKTDYWCGKPSDPEFQAKMLDIVGLYLNPPENALVLCVDEKTHIQALDRSQPVLPMEPGRNRRLTATYTRHGTVSLMAAFSVHSGNVTARTIERNTSETFLAFLKSLYRKHPGREMHIIVDNLATHKTPAVRDWVSRRRRLTLHYTPTYASWLNQVEIWFNILTRDVLRDGVWTSKKQLVSQLMAYVKAYSKDRAKPFKWTYTGNPCQA